MKQYKDTPYYVTENGRIFNDKKQLKTYRGERYEKLVIKINGKATSRYVHRMVAETFIENPDNKKTVNHLDGNKMNNCVSNLEWATSSENNYHSYKVGLKIPYDRKGENNPNYKHGKRIKL